NLYSETPIATGKACYVTGILVLIPFLVSNFNLALIAFHRYILIVRSGLYKKLFSNTRVIVYVIGVWTFGILLTIPPVFGWGRITYNAPRSHCMIDWSYSTSYLFFIQIIGFPIPLFVMVFSYYKVFTHSYSSRKRLRASTDRHNLRQNSREISLSICLLIVLIVFFSLFAPYAVLIYTEGIFHKKASPAFGFAAMFLAYSNSMCDFWIYAGMSKKFRASCFNLFRRILFFYCKRNDSKVYPDIKGSSAVAICDVNSEDNNKQQMEHNLNFTPTLSSRRRSVMDPGRDFYKNDTSSSTSNPDRITSLKRNTFDNYSSRKNDIKPFGSIHE
ncbi:MAG: G-protein coupled receptor, partial [Cyanobacteria bacterium J06649_11]